MSDETRQYRHAPTGLLSVFGGRVAPRSHNPHPLHQAEGQYHVNSSDDQRQINGRSLDRQPDDQEERSYFPKKIIHPRGAGDIAKSATMILIKESARQVVFGPAELVTPCQPIEWLFRLSSFPASAKRVTSAVQSP